mgnify:CR=1 FL=1
MNNAFDSMKLNNGTPGIEVAVSNLVNNLYSRDIGKKVRAALEVNWKSGKATSVNVPFGYVWNGKAISDGRLTQKRRPASERCLIWHYLDAIQRRLPMP